MVRVAFGRTSEIAEMSWDEVRWDEHAQVATVSWYEMKTSKTKTAAHVILHHAIPTPSPKH
jgi:hypothetical protein